MTTLLKDGSTVEDPRLDRLPQWDERNADYPAHTLRAIASAQPWRNKSWRVYVKLDQGQEGACVEFGWCHELNAQPVSIPTKEVRRITEGHLIYHPAQRNDYWEGGSYPGATPFYEGTSVLAGAQVAAELGFITEYRWITDDFANQIALVLGYHGPIVVGIDWHEGMFDPGPSGIIHPTGRIGGGHCVAVTRIYKRGGVWYVSGPNSWGKQWGDKGDWHMPLDEFVTLCERGGDICVPVHRTRPA